jgi:hypothetical protein
LGGDRRQRRSSGTPRRHGGRRGRTFVTGWTYKPDLSDPDFITLAYDAAGGLLWSKERGGIPGGDDYAGTLALGSHGTLFVTGSSDNGTNQDFLTVAYSPGGYELFEHRYDGGGDDQGYLAIAGPDGSVFLGGVSDGAGRDFFVYQLFGGTGLFTDSFVSSDGRERRRALRNGANRRRHRASRSEDSCLRSHPPGAKVRRRELSMPIATHLRPGHHPKPVRGRSG